jgi:hypothetical protein
MKGHAISFDGQLQPVQYCLKKVQTSSQRCKKTHDYTMKDRAISYDGRLLPVLHVYFQKKVLTSNPN